ncbi:MAG: hypothetical protein ACREEW_05930 [Caulobacteraceae bacterium]
MPSDAMTPADDEAAEAAAAAKRTAKKTVADIAETGQRSFSDTMDTAERNFRDAARRVEKVMREGVEALKVQAEPLRENASQQIDEAQKYVLERVKERPVTATLAGVGLGLLLGLLLANRSAK